LPMIVTEKQITSENIKKDYPKKGKLYPNG